MITFRNVDRDVFGHHTLLQRAHLWMLTTATEQAGRLNRRIALLSGHKDGLNKWDSYTRACTSGAHLLDAVVIQNGISISALQRFLLKLDFFFVFLGQPFLFFFLLVQVLTDRAEVALREILQAQVNTTMSM